MDLSGPHCRVCQKCFDSKELLRQHLQQNPDHLLTARPNSTSKRSQTRLNPRSNSTILAANRDGLGSGRATSLRQGARLQPRWLQLTLEQTFHLDQLISSLCHPVEILKRAHYLIENRDPSELGGVQKCCNCQKRRRDLRDPRGVCVFHTDKVKFKKGKRPRKRKCCASETRGCQTLPEHIYQPLALDESERSPIRDATQNPGLNVTKRNAVVLDCEMVGVKGGVSELAQLCVVDLFTAEVLINRLVQPTEQVTDWRTRFSGITADHMSRAIREQQALRGWRAARQELWEYVDSETVFIGHALQHDLNALHLIHDRIIDTSIVTRLAVDQESQRNWSLKDLCAELLDLDIQNRGKAGHDCLEDTLATREVFLYCILNPGRLTSWATVKRGEEQARKTQREINSSQRQQSRVVYSTAGQTLHTDERLYSSESERLHWSDIAEDLGWPHPDTGYDPWSD